MRVTPRLATFFAVSGTILSASAGPLAERDSTTSTSSSSQPTAALVVSTLSDGKPTTVELAFPTSLISSNSAVSTTVESSVTATPAGSTTSTATSSTVSPLNPSHDFPACHDTSAAPFCLPNNESTLYVGNTYYVTWNPDYFLVNSTITIKLNYANDSQIQAWSSDPIDNSWGVTTITMDKAWLQGYTEYNLTFYALMFESADPSSKSVPYDGPSVMLTNTPPSHYAPPERTKAPNKMGLMVGLPVSLGFCFLVVVGLWLGMRKHRTIGLGNVMGRRGGYGAGKSRRQRLGFGKKGAIRLQEREVSAEPQYRDIPPAPRIPGHGREESLGSLVSDDGIRPHGNAFRQELERQKTGR